MNDSKNPSKRGIVLPTPRSHNPPPRRCCLNQLMNSIEIADLEEIAPYLYPCPRFLGGNAVR